MTQDAGQLADQFYAALTSGDLDTCGRLFASDAVIWHNFDLTEKPPAEALAPVAAMLPLAPRFEVVERVVVPDGWIQQHRFHFSFPDGETRALAAIQRVRIRDGLIARVDEYMDTAQVGAVVAKAQSA